MKYLIIISFILSCVVGSYGQTKLLDGMTFVISDKEDKPNVYEVNVTRTSTNKFNVDIKYLKEVAQSFSISPLKLNTFTTKFITAVKGAKGPNEVSTGNDANLQIAASRLYHNIVVQNSLNPAEETGPKAGNFVVHKNIPVYATTYKSSGNINTHCPSRAVYKGSIEVEAAAKEAAQKAQEAKEAKDKAVTPKEQKAAGEAERVAQEAAEKLIVVAQEAAKVEGAVKKVITRAKALGALEEAKDAKAKATNEAKEKRAIAATDTSAAAQEASRKAQVAAQEAAKKLIEKKLIVARKGAGIPATISETTAAVRAKISSDVPFARITATTTFEVQKVHVVIHNGFINEITAVVKIGGIEYIFDNPVPIGISSIQNLKIFNKYYLRCRNPLTYKVVGNKKGEVDYVINLRDVLEYIPEPSRNVLDKSPRNKTHTIVVKGDTTIRTVYKEPVSRLIQASIFSDFMGLEENKPNGLIQTEIYRRINLHTIRHQFFDDRKVNWGVLQYLRPEVSISKVEDKKRVLYLDYLSTNINGQERTHAYASSIDLHLYQYMRAGSLFNLALIQNPDLHTTLEFNTGFYFGMVPLKDSLRLNPTRLPESNEYTAVTFETFLETNIKFSMNKYIEFSMSYTPFVLFGLGKYYNQVKDRDDFVNNLEQGSFWDRSFLGKAELLLWVKPAPNKSNGKFFGRYRFVHQLSNPNLYYHQIQVGYSFYLEIPRPKS